MKVSIKVFVFCICSLMAFGCGLDEDLTEIRQMMRKLIEENAIMREKNAILRSEVESMRRQCEEENAILRSEVDAINIKLEGVQEGNNIL